MQTSSEKSVANIVVQSLYNAGVRVVFGIPGAKIDAIFDALSDHKGIKLIVCRHEQNAAFMAAAVGRITEIPGVCVATSGPGAGNLTTGLVTATTEGDPVVALVGSVTRLLSTKRTHQSMRTLDILRPTVTAGSATNIDVEDQAAEVILSAFRHANSAAKGSAVVSIPMDIAAGKSSIDVFPPTAFKPPMWGPAALKEIAKAVVLIEQARLPVLFLGQRAASPSVVNALRSFLKKHPIPVVSTFHAAGAISEELAPKVFFGRVGLFRNQVGDRLMQKSDLVIAVGYDPTEYDASSWNPSSRLNIVHCDYVSCDHGAHYPPKIELLGSIMENIRELTGAVKVTSNPTQSEFCRGLCKELTMWREDVQIRRTSGLVHPLHFVDALQERVSKDTTVTCDVGTVYIYMMRYFFAYEPRKLLCSNGQQTLGIGMPWAIAASLVQDPPCSQKVVSLAGDGGFMFSAQELSTAVQQKCNITQFIWNDEAYNMVEFQGELKYGRSSGIKLGGIDFVKLAEAFGGKGFRISDSSEIEKVMDEALAHEGVSIVDVRIDYSNVRALAGNLIKDSYNSRAILLDGPVCLASKSRYTSSVSVVFEKNCRESLHITLAMADTPGTVDLLDEIGQKAPQGVVIPPRNIRRLIEKTAGFVSRSGKTFEDRIRQTQGDRSAFLFDDNPYNSYYQWRLECIKDGETNEIAQGREGQGATAALATGAVSGGQGGDWKGREERQGPEKPEDFDFSARMPNISAQDLEIVKLTALFVAKNGRSWMTSLSQREAGNYQFDFLRPQHSLYQFFSRLVDQYTDLLTGPTVDDGRPFKRRKEKLEENVRNRFHILERAKKRSEWLKYQESQKQERAEKDEQERISYQQIDWHDFVVVQTIAFDEEDEKVTLAAPASKNDVQSASLEQKAAMRIGSDRRIEEAFPSMDDQDFYGAGIAQQQQQQQPQALPVQPPFAPQQQAYTPTPPQVKSPWQPPQAHGEDGRLPTIQQEREAARRAQEAARAQQPMKIRNDYVPRAQARRQATNTSICPNCRQPVPNEEMAEHMRIELLDPRWREQRGKEEQRSSTTNLNTVDVASNLKRLASQRTDVFDPVTGHALTEEEMARRKRAELGSYDGVGKMPSMAAFNSVNPAGGTAPPGTEPPADVQEQIRQLQNKYKSG
ncbi:acetolactate synthase [Polychaeton citri CBS 116435]|uniref:Acetolactate synthase n=1 Tax=Polychaeton citri CBS 116435 TaxID=1314669 RepID=A0A9P4UTH8_9PEZI|nr:acetolactate synthase [Polychaeton citri CBS 116435]